MHLFARLSGLALLCGLLTQPLQGMAQPATDATSRFPGSANWKQLSAAHKTALAPLSGHWAELSETQRSKWLAIARHFDQLSPAEQQVMHSRMREWVTLSPVQRNQARLNFNSLQSISKDQKKSRWDEYQTLSEEEKRKLSAGAPGPAKTTAPSAKPVAGDRLVQPTVRAVPPAAQPSRAPIDRNTLLPVPAIPPEAPAPAPALPAADPSLEAPAS